MNWIETLRFYEPLAEWLILLVIVYELFKPQERGLSADQLNQRRRRRWPWIAAAVFVTGIAWGPVILRHFSVGETQAPAFNPQRPLADDSLKWRLQDDLGRDTRVPAIITNTPNPQQCQVVIVHDVDTYSRHLAEDVDGVITASGGNAQIQFHADLPDQGIRVFAPKGRQWDCASRFTTRLGMVLGVIDSRYANLQPDHAEKLTPAMAAFGELGNCYEIDIGPQPGS